MANVHALEQGMSALHFASDQNQIDIMKLLVEAGMDVNLQVANYTAAQRKGAPTLPC